MQKWNKLKKVDLNDTYSDWKEQKNEISKFTFLYPFIIDENNKIKR